MMCELEAGANSNMPAKTLQDLRSNWESRVGSWRGREGTYLTPLVEDAVKGLDDWSRTAALQRGADKLEESQTGDDDAGSSEDETYEGEPLVDVPTASHSTSSSKRKRRATGRRHKGEPPRPTMAAELLAIRIALPSSLHPIIRNHPALRVAVAMEQGLREHQALDALDDLRTQLITSAGMRKKKQEVSGQKRITRAAAAIIRKNKAVQNAAAEYRRARTALLALGMSADHDEFRELKKEDIRAFTVLIEEQVLGDSKKFPSWIWENLEFINARGEGAVKEYFEEGKCDCRLIFELPS